MLSSKETFLQSSNIDELPIHQSCIFALVSVSFCLFQYLNHVLPIEDKLVKSHRDVQADEPAEKHHCRDIKLYRSVGCHAQASPPVWRHTTGSHPFFCLWQLFRRRWHSQGDRGEGRSSGSEGPQLPSESDGGFAASLSCMSHQSHLLAIKVSDTDSHQSQSQIGSNRTNPNPATT